MLCVREFQYYSRGELTWTHWQKWLNVHALIANNMNFFVKPGRIICRFHLHVWTSPVGWDWQDSFIIFQYWHLVYVFLIWCTSFGKIFQEWYMHFGSWTSSIQITYIIMYWFFTWRMQFMFFVHHFFSYCPQSDVSLVLISVTASDFLVFMHCKVSITMILTSCAVAILCKQYTYMYTLQ